MKTVLALSALGVASFASAAQADLVAYWNFNTLTPSGGGAGPSNAGVTSYAPATGAGSINLTGWTSRAGTTSPFGITNFAGSTVNAIAPDAAGQALALEGGTTALSNNNATLDVVVSLTNLQNPILTFASRNTSTGFNNNQVSWSTDGINYTNFATYALTTTFALQSFDFSAVNALDNASTVYLRITFLGATTASGNNRIDNVQVNASIIPTPGAAALLGLGSLAMVRRRRAR